MLKKTITFTDFNGVEKKKDYRFHLSKAELMEMEIGTTGGYAEMIQKIVDTQDGPQLIKIFKELVLKAYGELSPDGERFIKSEELSTAFSQTEAYSQIFMELATNDIAASEFISGIMPADLAEQAAAQMPKLAPVDK